ncbi:ABC transporter permease [Halanaerobium hydrogeniformans]|uniref:Binding-protein-dependent transport systems inner membrane component n=1 Tax=Halanaerobium hydrogeniformans TaxID=656519 RepID=E4RIY0_HALHG|nr:ABC transporter permease [Halanaerobium hydrogeniformans]ADQ15200.1 binding-protein-dependent transport systems inner membrane component [Halanaerobium hydrogeniformans]
MLLEYWQIFVEEGITLMIQHLRLVGFSVFIAILIALPTGIILSRNFIKNYSEKLIFFFNIAQGLPSLAVIALVLPFLGIGFVPAVTALIIYALLPIIRNTIAGLNNIETDLIEAAQGMGMTPFEILYKIELPLALPVIIAGIQTAAVVTVGTAVVSNLIGAGGLGQMIFTGLAMFDRRKILLGSLLAAFIAIIIDRSFELLGRKLK